MIEIIYCNGCSHSAGGGLEVSKDLEDGTNVRDYYYSKYKVWWHDQIETTYANRLAEMIGCDVENEAASGGGTGRVIRMAYDFVKRNWHRKDKLLLLFELPTFFQRIDLYSTKLQDWVIVNQSFNDKGIRTNLAAVRKYYVPEYLNDELLIGKNVIDTYLNSFVNIDIETQKMNREIDTFLTFLKHNEIKFIYFEGNPIELTSDYVLPNRFHLEYNNKIYTDFHNWIMANGYTIASECDNKTYDLHPGYFGHIKFAETLYDYIKDII